MPASALHWRLLIATILALMAAIWLAPRWLPRPDIQENRVLAAQPAWPQRLSDIRAFRKAADAYVADHFPARPYLIGALNRLRVVAGVSGSSRVIVGRDGWLFFDDETHLGAARGDPPMTGPEIRLWLETLAGRTEFLRARGIPYLVVTPPVKETLYPQQGPYWYRGPNASRPTILLPHLARDSGVGEILYLRPGIARVTHAGGRTYSRHDTHWTGLGAYAGYVDLMDRLHALGLADAPLPFADFERQRQDPRGPRDLALMLGVASFVDVDYHLYGDRPGQVSKHVTYLGSSRDWTAPQVIDTDQVGKPVLLMTRDSFSNALLPFLLPHFRRIILTHIQDGFWRPDLVDQFKPDIVLLEVIEPGLRVAMAKGPAPSDVAMARIDHALAATAQPSGGAQTTLLPNLAAPDAHTAAAMAAAVPTVNCNFEMATLKPGVGGEATFTGSGWISELGPRITAPNGLIALSGPGGPYVAALPVDKSRPDVAAFFKTPTGAASGFVGDFFVRHLPPGSYAPSVYRRAGAGWIVCHGKQALTAP